MNAFPLSGLVNYWPFNGLTKDIIGGMDMKIHSNDTIKFSPDRLNNSNSAMSLINSIYGSVPPGIYFDSTAGFTYMSWVNVLNTPQDFARIGN